MIDDWFVSEIREYPDGGDIRQVVVRIEAFCSGSSREWVEAVELHVRNVGHEWRVESFTREDNTQDEELPFLSKHHVELLSRAVEYVEDKYGCEVSLSDVPSSGDTV